MSEPPVPTPRLADDRLERRIVVLRGVKVMLDRDLALLYGVPTKVFNQAVKRNLDRFPPDFRFALTQEEAAQIRPQSVTGSGDRRNVRYPPTAFTEYGVAMLSGVLQSPRAIQVNVAIMRAFGRLRATAAWHTDLRAQLEELERRYDGQFARVFEALRSLMRDLERLDHRLGP